MIKTYHGKFLGTRFVDQGRIQVAVFSTEFGSADFVLNKASIKIRRQNRIKYRQDIGEEDKALAALDN